MHLQGVGALCMVGVPCSMLYLLLVLLLLLVQLLQHALVLILMQVVSILL